MMYVWLPFGERLHEHHKILPIERPEWWVERAQILKDYTLPSLRNQMLKNFAVVAGIPLDFQKIAAPVIKAIAEAGASIWVHPLREQWAEGQEAEIGFLLSRRDVGFWVVHLDADDMYAPEALQALAEVKPEDGKTVYFQNGYILDTLRNEAFVYRPGKCPAPFFMRWYPGKMDYKRLREYRETFRYNSHHHQLSGVPVREQLGDGFYCVTAHNSNTTTGMLATTIAPKIGSPVDAAWVRSKFGCKR